jgi:hypothetical protein
VKGYGVNTLFRHYYCDELYLKRKGIRTMKKQRYLLLTCIVLIGLIALPGCEKAPVANAGPDQTVNGGALVTLDGSGSTDPDTPPQQPGPLTYSWVQTAGTTVTLNGATTANPTFIAPNENGTLTFTLTVTDDGNQSSTDSVSITVTKVSQPPVANAGPDQTVKAGATVTLDGSASTDPTGGTLTYSWKQTSGTTVTLNGATTAQPTFTAPGVSDTLVFELTVTNSQNVSSTDTVNVTVQSVAMLYIANLAGDNVTSYKNPSTVNGNIVPDNNLQGLNTKLNNPSDMVVTKEQTLVVSNIATPSITSYKDASAANGNLKPDGNVQGAQTLLVNPTSMAINTEEDLLFVTAAVGVPSGIAVYEGASTSVFNGNLAPTRGIISNDLNNPLGINFGANDELYVANTGNNNVVVFTNASTKNGTVAPERTITSPSFAGQPLWAVFIDAHDTMFVVNGNGAIYIFDNASTLNGSANPDFTLRIPIAGLVLTDIVVDSNDTGYIVDNAHNAIYSYDNISTQNGTFNPDRTIRGTNTQLNGPVRVFLTE